MAGDRDNYKSVSSSLTKLILNNISIQLMVTIGAVVLYIILRILAGTGIANLVVTCIFVPALLYAIYSNNWGTALKDKNLVQYGRLEENRYRGLISGLIGAIPVVVYTIFAIGIAQKQGVDSEAFAAYKIFTAPYNLFTDYLSTRAPILMLLYGIFSPAAAALGYHNGYKEYRIWDHILYENGIKPRKDGRSGLPKARKPKK